jgi:hypothetical protein
LFRTTTTASCCCTAVVQQQQQQNNKNNNNNNNKKTIKRQSNDRHKRRQQLQTTATATTSWNVPFPSSFPSFEKTVRNLKRHQLGMMAGVDVLAATASMVLNVHIIAGLLPTTN